MSYQEIRMSRADYDKLVQADRDLANVMPEFDKLESCGIDCAAVRQKWSDTREKIAAIKQHYAPKD